MRRPASGPDAEVTVVERPDADHFSIMAEWADPASPLFAALERNIDRSAPGSP